MKVLLICYGGLSTGMMKIKLEEQARSHGCDDVSIKATAIAEAENDLGDYDVYLLGPQVRYAVDDFRKRSNGKPVLVISAPDFGMMNAANVWKQIQAALKS